jgi:large subunit ribosomal protein L21
MYAIIADGGKQYKVEPGQTVYVETRDLPEGATTIEFDQVLLVGAGAEARIGTPWVSGAKVIARIESAMRGPKELIVKFRRRKGYRLKKGHRQNYLKVKVESINA